MDRRTFLTTTAAAVITPLAPIAASPASVGVDLASGPSKTFLFVTSSRKGLTARCAAMAYALEQHGYQVSVEQIKSGIQGVTPTRAILDDLSAYKFKQKEGS